ncbi:GNAT family N-acetyltransferase [Shewanella aestuarii]|uniref:Protein ElaA n=1 Tax=Shewanella aestuarii TaxID=1028752 RepID=A0A6G9QND4_9GAMM|nr:GNAT family N-acetyltransferase [Shewanella aestuarii]QIR16076.1 GNAT family N-acetyltransferase [Shewanella aestuarii]
MQWQILPFNQLSIDQLYELLTIRVDVFVVEQNCAYSELDNKDRHPQALHLLGYADDNTLAAYCRILPPEVSYPQASIGRVLVVKSHRGKGLAEPLMQQAIDIALSQWPESGIQIGAQQHLQAFYQRLGFMNHSKVYLEDGIPHLDMIYQA